MTTEAVLKVQNLKKSFGALKVVRDVSLEVKRGEVIFIIGPSGSGKSTFLRCLNFLEQPNGGSIEFDGITYCRKSTEGFWMAKEADIRQVRSRVPIVFQHFNLFRHMTALQNVMEGPVSVLRRDKNEVEARAKEILAELGLGEKLHSYPAQLSGGQQQRVGIARAMAMQPAMILFDEPTSALDPELVSGILEAIRKLAEGGMTMIIVTHEMRFARRLADIVYFMDKGEIIEFGPPQEIFDTPKSSRLQLFLSQLEE